MIHLTRNILNRTAFRSLYRFSNSYECMKQALAKNLYSIELTNQELSRKKLAMVYSPGVAAVCEAIESDPIEAQTLTLRGRSIAVVTDGSFLDTSSEGVGPALDWIIAQIKYYTGLDAFPFIIDKDTDMEEALKDFSTSYGTVLQLDNKDLPLIPRDLLVVRHQDVVNITQSELTDCHKTANVISYLISRNRKGLAKKDFLKAGLNHEGSNDINRIQYSSIINDGRDLYTHALKLHEHYKGKIQVEVNFFDILKIKDYFTEANLRKYAKEQNPYSKTSRLAAIVTNGTAVLGLGNIGPRAGLPVVEGKSLLFKLLANVEVVPLAIYPKQTIQDQVNSIIKILGNFEAINLEDFKAPECFAIEQGLNALRKVPVFHDDQHGPAIVVLAGLINAVKVVQKDMKSCKVVINGAGAAGITIAKLLIQYGVKDIIVCDSKGAIYKGRKVGMNDSKHAIAEKTNKDQNTGKLKDVMAGADIFVGVSSESALRGHWASKMAKKSIIFALANPFPEILPEDAKSAGAWVYASGRSDAENQINDALVFPGIFRAITEHRIKVITEEMKIKAAEAIARRIDGQPARNRIIPESLDKDVAIQISNELGKVAAKDKAAK